MKREPFPLIRLSKNEKETIMEEIAAFYLDEHGDKIGMMEQQQILETSHFTEERNPIYEPYTRNKRIGNHCFFAGTV